MTQRLGLLYERDKHMLVDKFKGCRILWRELWRYSELLESIRASTGSTVGLK